MLLIEAQTDPMTHALVLTTRDPNITGAEFKRSSEQIWKALRRRLDRAEYFTRIEFTTGQGRRSGGHRRIHSHSICKLAGDALRDLPALEEVVRRIWKARTEAWRIELRELKTPAGAIAYLNMHHAKPDQAPPDWWSGRTERVSAGFWATPSAQLRERAKAELWAERLAYSTGLELDDARLLVGEELQLRAAMREARAALRASAPWEPILEGEDDWQQEIPF